MCIFAGVVLLRWFVILRILSPAALQILYEDPFSKHASRSTRSMRNRHYYSDALFMDGAFGSAVKAVLPSGIQRNSKSKTASAYNPT